VSVKHCDSWRRVIATESSRQLHQSAASPGFGAARRGTKRHRNNLSHTHIITQNRAWIYTVIQRYPICTCHFFNKMKKTNFINCGMQILKISRIRDYRHTVYSSKVKRNQINCWKSRGARDPVPHSWRRQWHRL